VRMYLFCRHFIAERPSAQNKLSLISPRRARRLPMHRLASTTCARSLNRSRTKSRRAKCVHALSPAYKNYHALTDHTTIVNLNRGDDRRRMPRRSAGCRKSVRR
jgi:hypothetical protein